MILIYDVAVERVSKVLKKSREYLTWIQNSVFEGEITEANLLLLKRELEDIIDKNYDSIIIFILRTKYDEKIILGRIKNEPTSMF